MWSACPETHRPWRPCRGRAGARPEGGSASSLLSMVVARTADVLVQQAGLFRLARLPVLSIPKDRRDRAVRAGAQCQRSRAGSIQPLGVVARRQPKNADAGTEPLLGMRARAQDDLDQRRGVVADRLGFSQDPLVRPVVNRAGARPALKIDACPMFSSQSRMCVETGWRRHEADYVVVPLALGDCLLLEPGGGSRTATLTL